MNPQLVIIAVGIIAPVCIVLFVRRAIISVPLGIIVVLVCYSGWPGWPEKDWFWVEQWLIAGLCLGFYYVWFLYGCRRACLFWRRVRVTPSNQKAAVIWRWVLLCSLACNFALLAVCSVQARRGYIYLDTDAFPVRATITGVALFASSLLSFVASPLLFERCGTLAFISWITAFITPLCA